MGAFDTIEHFPMEKVNLWKEDCNEQLQPLDFQRDEAEDNCMIYDPVFGDLVRKTLWSDTQMKSQVRPDQPEQDECDSRHNVPSKSILKKVQKDKVDNTLVHSRRNIVDQLAGRGLEQSDETELRQQGVMPVEDREPNITSSGRQDVRNRQPIRAGHKDDIDWWEIKMTGHTAEESPGMKDDAVNLTTVLFAKEDDPQETIWSILTDEVYYSYDPYIEGNLTYEESTVRPEDSQIFSSANCNKPHPTPQIEEEIRYEGTIPVLTTNFCPDKHISCTYLYSTKRGVLETDEVNYYKTGCININNVARTASHFPQFPNIEVSTLIDTGATTCIINQRFIEKHAFMRKFPLYHVAKRPVTIGDGKKIYVDMCSKFVLDVDGHLMEIIAFIIDAGSNSYDVIIGAKGVFELEASIKFTNLRLEFPAKSIALKSRAPVSVLPGETKEITLILEKEPPAFGPGIACLKLFTQEPNKQVQTTRGIVLWNEKKLRHEIVKQVRNTTDQLIHINGGETVGILDLRSMGYRELTRQTLRRILGDRLELLTDEDTLDFIQHAFQAHKTVQGEATTKDPYPWLEKDDPRKTQSDEEIIRDSVDLKEAAMTPKEKEHFLQVLITNKKVFSLREDIGLCPKLRVKLEIKDKTPFFIRPFPIKEEYKEIIDKEMRKGMLLGILKKGLSSYSSPVMLIPRKNQKRLRIITDFRHLNNRLVKLNPSIPLVRDAIQMLGASKCEVISVLDLRDAYHTLRLDKESQQYCGITPYYGSPSYLYQRLGMGLTVSPAIWQSFINTVLDELPNRKHHLAIMDDCLVHSMKKDHEKELLYLFKALMKYGLKLSPKKCQFYRISLTYMGHTMLIRDGRACITPLRLHVDAVLRFEPPKTPRECKRFCGLVNFLAFYLEKLQVKLAPIYEMSSKRVTFKWGPEQQKAFEDIKQLLVEPPVLTMPRKEGRFELHSDTSKTGCGAALFQHQDGEKRLCAYYSKKLPDPCKRYGITELEMTGLTCNITAFKHLLRHAHFTVLVDHTAIKYIMVSKNEIKTDKLKTLWETLSQYTFDIAYLEGKKMVIADYLSRHVGNDPDAPGEVIPITFDTHSIMAVETRAMRRERESKDEAPESEPVEAPEQHEGRLPSGPKQVNQEYALKECSIPLERISLQKKQVEFDPLVDLIPEMAVRPKPKGRKHRKERKLEEILNPLPVDITLTGMIPTAEFREDEIPEMTFPPPQANRQSLPLGDSTKKIEVVRRTMPKQKDITPIIKQIAKTVLHSYRMPISMTELIAAYQKSPYFKDIYKYVSRGASSFTGKADTLFKQECAEYTLLQGVLFRTTHLREEDEPKLVLCVPEDYIPLILYQFHDLILAGHQGTNRTYHTIRRKYYFPHMLQYVRKYIEACHRCQETRRAHAQPQAIYVRVPMSFKPFDSCSVDIKHMPKSGYGFKFLLVMTCEITNFVEAAALETERAAHIFAGIFSKIVCRYGQPRVIISDKGSGFTSKLMAYLYTKLRIRPYVVNPANKGSNRTERYIQSLSNQLVKYLEDEGGEWPLYVPACTFAMNTFVSPITGYSPYEMVFGREPPDLTEIAADIDDGVDIAPAAYMTALQSKLKIMAKVIKEGRIRQQSIQQIREQRKHPDDISFAKGDFVMIKRPRLSELQSGTRKFVRSWIGPVKIVSVLAPDKYLIADWEGTIPPIIIGRKELKPYLFQNTTANSLYSQIRNADELIQQLSEELKKEKGKVDSPPTRRPDTCQPDDNQL